MTVFAPSSSSPVDGADGRAFDLVCMAPPFLDVTFVGLAAVPAPGEELFADELAVSAGGAATTATGAARLGLRVGVVWPRGRDLPGRHIAALLADEGVDWIGREVPRAAVTAIMPVEGDRAMATYQPPEEPSKTEIESIRSRALVVPVDRVGSAPPGPWMYVVTGFDETRRLDATALPPLGSCRALLVNEAEARGMTGEPEPGAAARRLGRLAPRVVVTLGRRGALEWEDGSVIDASAPAFGVVDTTGAGDLFAAAYIWADLAGLERHARLALATLYAGLSVRRATGMNGAVTLRELEAEARARGLAVPGGMAVSIKEAR